jgi:hypothetical protein
MGEPNLIERTPILEALRGRGPFRRAGPAEITKHSSLRAQDKQDWHSDVKHDHARFAYRFVIDLMHNSVQIHRTTRIRLKMPRGVSRVWRPT